MEQGAYRALAELPRTKRAARTAISAAQNRLEMDLNAATFHYSCANAQPTFSPIVKTRRLAIAFGSLMALLALWLLLILIKLPLPTSAAQRAAFDLLQTRQAPGPGNAYAALWLFKWDVPAGQIDAIMAEDQARFVANPSDPEFVSVAAARYREIYGPDSSSSVELCSSIESGCLASARNQGDTLRREVAAAAQVLEKHRTLRTYQELRWVLGPSLHAPFVGVGRTGGYALTAAALHTADGDPERGLEEACEFAAIWRKLRGSTDILVSDMTAIAYIKGALDLVAEISAELPAERPLPASCESALAPLRDVELAQCDVMKAEFAYMRSHLESGDWIDLTDEESKLRLVPRKLFAALTHSEHAMHRIAPIYARFCDALHANRIERRTRLPALVPPIRSCSYLATALDPIGCLTTAPIPDSPNLSTYYDRVLDLDARLRSFALARKLALASSDAEIAAQIANPPPALRTPSHTIQFDPLHRELVVTQLQLGEWRVPLPGSLFEREDHGPSAEPVQ
jgi:hypothetical protein